MSRHIFIQVAIALVAILVYWTGGGNWPAAASIFASMQLGNLLGLRWGARLRRRVQQSALPILRH